MLRGVSLHVPIGSTVALVGATGSGKTSILATIPRLYDVSGGAVRIDGHAVGDRGGRLSLGQQQQRVALARAFLKDAPILLLDEPTAALDLQTEADLIDGMTHLMEGRTVVIVAHRLSTIRHADTMCSTRALLPSRARTIRCSPRAASTCRCGARWHRDVVLP